MREFIRVMKAVADATRVKILKMLQQRVMCVCEVQAALGTAQSTASKHLKILEEAGLITSFRDGTWVNYRLGDGVQSPYAASLIGNIKHWLDGEPEIIELIKKLPDIRREEVCKS
jgi:ArsR family transcriptional regulator